MAPTKRPEDDGDPRKWPAADRKRLWAAYASDIAGAAEDVENARQALEEAVSELREEIVQNVRDAYMPVAQVARAAGLSRETVYEILRKHDEAEASRTQV